MIFIILIVLGLAGILGTLWFSYGSLRYIEYPVPKGSEWFALSPETFESGFALRARKAIRGLIKLLLIWLIHLYRSVSKEIRVKQVVKQKVREFLYDHTPEGVRHPSEFWSHVKHRPISRKKTSAAPKESSLDLLETHETFEKGIEREEER